MQGAISTIVIHDYPIFTTLHYNLESIIAGLMNCQAFWSDDRKASKLRLDLYAVLCNLI